MSKHATYILLFFWLFFFNSRTIFAQEAYNTKKTFIHYTDADGLPFASIDDFFQDDDGFMWIGTKINICRFDGYRFQEFDVVDLQGERTVVSQPRFIFNEYKRELFISTLQYRGAYPHLAKGRLFKYVEGEGIFKECPIPFKVQNIQSINTSSFGGFWISRDKQVWHLDSTFSNPQTLEQIIPSSNINWTGEKVSDLIEHNGILYGITEEGNLCQVTLENGNTKNFRIPIPIESILGLFVDFGGHVWVRTFGEGLLRLNPQDGEFLHFITNGKGARKITSNLVRSICEDMEHQIWIGTEFGLCIWDPFKDNMEIYQYSMTQPEGINDDAVYAIYCDQKGDVWVGTYFGGINIYQSTQKFFKSIIPGVGDYHLSGQQVSSIIEDQESNLWIGLEGDGVNVIDATTGKVRKMSHIPGENSLSYDNVHDIKFGSDDRAYIATYTGGLNIYDPSTHTFDVLHCKNYKVFHSDNIYTLFVFGDSIFVGTDNGLIIYDTKQHLILPFYPHIFNDKEVTSICRSDSIIWFSIGSNLVKYDVINKNVSSFDRFDGPVSISFVMADSNGNLWIGDNYQGLRVYWQDMDTVVHYSYLDGFPAKRTYGAIQGKNGQYWISSNRGLVKFDPVTRNSVVYDRSSGLPFSQFNYLAFYKNNLGDIYFGGINGLIYFNEDQSFPEQDIEKIVFSGFTLSNEPVNIGSELLPTQPIHRTEKIRLKYDQNVFGIHFSALDYSDPGRIQYAFFLENFEDTWQMAGNQPYASYTNVPPGEYVFQVKASYDNVHWTGTESTIQISIAPPIWFSKIAYFFYTILILGGLVLFYYMSIKLEKSKSLAALERKEKEHQQKVNQIKLDFFTNVSHELRTPVTLILGPLQHMLQSWDLQPKIEQKLKGIYRNAQRLHRLVNQIMDFRKIDNKSEKLQVQKANIEFFLHEIRDAFVDVAEDQHIEFKLNTDFNEEEVFFDPAKLEHIFFNLLSNALKFTRPGGSIFLKANLVSEQKNSYSQLLKIVVQDNGIGIEKSKLPHIFDKFYQADRDTYSKGSGIGLALVKSLIHLHKGTIGVKSEFGEGTEFSINIPVSDHSYALNERAHPNAQFTNQIYEWVSSEFASGIALGEVEKSFGIHTVLVVDDNEELLDFLKENLGTKWNVLTACDGIDALAAIHRKRPDLVVSDVMMPEMDGIELTRLLKTNLETSHIPVILLTARSEVEHRFEGMSVGADYYLTKPFYPQILIKHIENILSTRQKLIEIYKGKLDVSSSEIAHSKSDQEFLDKITRIVTQNLDNSNLDVGFLLRELCVSRSLLHLKLKKIVNSSTTEFIRSVRLKKAAKMILTGEKSISEVAYATGFSSPSIFSRRFKEYFGKSPSVYAIIKKPDVRVN